MLTTAMHIRFGAPAPSGHYEPFAGSGSQFVVGEQEGRLVYGCEIQPVFVAAILERLAGLGLAPRLAE